MASNVSDDNKLSNNENTSEAASGEGSSSVLASNFKTISQKVKKLTKVLSYKYWDPLMSSDWDAAGPPCPMASTRIKRDLTALFKDPLPGIFAIPDEGNFCLVHCLVLGPFDTPYEGGLFHFAVRFGPSYPIHPPRVRLMTTGAGQVRFNPNLYANGKVCLSILGTWTGPVWSPALNLGSLLLSIQSLLNEKPFYNEPGFKSERYYGESDLYNQYLTHETVRVSVCDQLEEYYCNTETTKLIPSELAEVMRETFMDLYDEYVELCSKNKRLDGQPMMDIFHVVKNWTFNFGNLLVRLKKLKEKFSSSSATEGGEKDKDSSLSSISDEDVDFSKAEESSNTKAVMEEATEFDIDVSEAAGTAELEECSVDDDIALFQGEGDEEYIEEESINDTKVK